MQNVRKLTKIYFYKVKRAAILQPFLVVDSIILLLFQHKVEHLACRLAAQVQDVHTVSKGVVQLYALLYPALLAHHLAAVYYLAQHIGDLGSQFLVSYTTQCTTDSELTFVRDRQQHDIATQASLMNAERRYRDEHPIKCGDVTAPAITCYHAGN